MCSKKLYVFLILVRNSPVVHKIRRTTSLCRCSVFLVERETQELVAKVFDGDVRKNKSGEIQPVREVHVNNQCCYCTCS